MAPTVATASLMDLAVFEPPPSRTPVDHGTGSGCDESDACRRGAAFCCHKLGSCGHNHSWGAEMLEIEDPEKGELKAVLVPSLPSADVGR